MVRPAPHPHHHQTPGDGDARVLTMQIHQECYRLRQRLRTVQGRSTSTGESSTCSAGTTRTYGSSSSLAPSVTSSMPPPLVPTGAKDTPGPTPRPTFRPPSRDNSTSSSRSRRRGPRPISPSSIVRRISDICEAELERKAERIRQAAASAAEQCRASYELDEEITNDDLPPVPDLEVKKKTQQQHQPTKGPHTVAVGEGHGEGVKTLEGDLDSCELSDVSEDVDATSPRTNHSHREEVSGKVQDVFLPTTDISFDVLYKYASDEDKTDAPLVGGVDSFGITADDENDNVSLTQCESEINMDEFCDANQSMRDFSVSRCGDESYPIQPVIAISEYEPNPADLEHWKTPAVEVMVKGPLPTLSETMANPQEFMANPQESFANPQDPSTAAPQSMALEEEYNVPLPPMLTISKPPHVSTPASDDTSVTEASVASTKSKSRRRRFIGRIVRRSSSSSQRQRQTASLTPSRPSSSWGVFLMRPRRQRHSRS